MLQKINNALDKTAIKVIGFDLDQTLYPKSPEIDRAIQTYLYDKIAERHGISGDEAKKKFDDLYQEGKGVSGGKAMAALGFPDGGELVQKALENAVIDEFLVPNQNTISLLKKIKGIYGRLDIVTGSNRLVTDKKMAKLEISDGLFDHIITADDGSKRDTSAFKKWMGYYPNLRPKNFLYIGDRVVSDHEEPQKMGIQTLLVYQKQIDPTVFCIQLKEIADLKSILLDC